VYGILSEPFFFEREIIIHHSFQGFPENLFLSVPNDFQAPLRSPQMTEFVASSPFVVTCDRNASHFTAIIIN